VNTGGSDAHTRAVAVRYAAVSKRFGATQAIRQLHLELAERQVHAFVGENGAGKSTCLGLLAGRIAPSDGTITVFGNKIGHGDPRASRRAGVAAIYQELTIVPALSPQANVFLPGPLAQTGFLSEGEMRARYVELCERIGVATAPRNVRAGDLSIAEQQLLEIMRALVSDAKVILFDEPTASLALPEREALLRLMADLRVQGKTLVFVSHNLDEVLQISDTITVFRDGELVASQPTRTWTKLTLVQTMLGDKAKAAVLREMLDGADSSVDSAPAGRTPRHARIGAAGPPLLAGEGITVPGMIRDIGFEVAGGEILGLGGLVGSGRTTLLRVLAGLERRASGRLWLDGREVGLPGTVRQSRRLGIGFIPEDRKGAGLVLGMTATDNIILSDLGAVAKHGFLSRRTTAASSKDAAVEMGFRADRVGELASNLSGGNQQKLLLARWRHSVPRILLADEPTRGIDIGAKGEIIDALQAMAGEGLGLILVSSDLEEVCAIADRILVLSEGEAAGVLDRDAGSVTAHDVLRAAFGIREPLDAVLA
jgi:ABC-type sugar transport system ATPase subunit